MDTWQPTRAPRAFRVIVLTGRSQAEDLSRAATAGARRVLIKPCTPDDLAAIIRNVLPQS